MRRSNTQNIKEVISELIKELGIEDKLNEVSIMNSWEEVLGKKIAHSTSRLAVKNKVLFVYLKSSVVRNELMMLKSSIIKALNDKTGKKVIEDIVFR
jgi:predicted nucleic acid-binding Zn ribbon protein